MAATRSLLPPTTKSCTEMIAAICGPTRWRSSSSASRLGRPQPAKTVTQSSLLCDDGLAERFADVTHLIRVLIVEHDDELAIRAEVACPRSIALPRRMRTVCGLCKGAICARSDASDGLSMSASSDCRLAGIAVLPVAARLIQAASCGYFRAAAATASGLASLSSVREDSSS